MVASSTSILVPWVLQVFILRKSEVKAKLLDYSFLFILISVFVISYRIVSFLFQITCEWTHFSGKSLPYEVQNHVRPSFVTPMLYAKNHSKFHKKIYRAVKPLELYFVNF
jgi:hypothetical protein